MTRTFFAMAALFASLLAAPALGQTAPPTPAPDASSRPAQQVLADGSYVFDGRSSLRFTMKQIYNLKDGTSVYFGEDFAFFHSTCGSSAFCNNVGGRDTDLRLGVQVAAPDIFLAASSGTFNGNGFSVRGLGFGVEKLARGERPLELTASFFYFPATVGTYRCPLAGAACYPAPTTTSPDYRVFKYAVGGHYALGDRPYYLNFGIAADNGSPNSAASSLQPWTFTHTGAYLGLGIKL
ncbi:MAG: hypothetical protein NVS9B12_12110 [Vulcanimicrobiaceae bacterium]